ncbi:C10 family peptidase [Xylanibacter muris]|uniref:Spi protease inhibitor domain-containing protein n=1 Tax=Xylanibacter muris TaxID=2736290 RepID=A0ABX2AMQ5_9BACT|nr:C10 family peptidase [Xylanibacter muris]NPD92511.1 hypothetical protein [Xylanibacter muris]
MKRKLSLAFLILLYCINGAFAERITESKAKDIAREFVSRTGSNRMKKAMASSMRMIKSSTGYYAYNIGENNGFVIVAADDKAMANVLGYADNGSIDTLNMPENMLWWLNEYNRQTEYATKQNTISAHITKIARNDIAPMVSSMWNQDSPYNDYCPSYLGVKCPSGCVATAIAQIMYFHKWPDTGTGSHSYEWHTGSATLSADFSKSTYNWNMMTDTYSSQSPAQSKDAVARLMYDIGIACEMNYNPNGSGTQSNNAATALVKHFKYDKSLKLNYRDFYTLTQWTELIYNELSEKRPVYYSGSNNSGGHAFVCDGYEDGYFHINWGWGGTSNGYFLLAALDPSQQGIGGSSAGYNYNQQCITGIKKEQNGVYCPPEVLCQGKLEISPAETGIHSEITLDGGFFYYGIPKRHLTFGIRVTGATEKETEYIKSEYSAELENMYGYSSYSISLSAFPKTPGEYYVYPAFCDEETGKWHDIMMMATNETQYYKATVKADRIVFTPEGNNRAVIEASDVTITSKAFTEYNFTGQATINCTSGYYRGDIRIGLQETGTGIISIVNSIVVDIESGMRQTVDFTAYAPSESGIYNMYILNADNEIISSGTEISVRTPPQGILKLYTTEPMEMKNANNVNPNDIEARTRIRCESGFNAEPVFLFFFPENGGSSISYITANCIIEAGETADIVFRGTAPRLEPGKRYIAIPYYFNSYGKLEEMASYGQHNRYCLFTVADMTGIDDTVQDSVKEINTPFKGIYDTTGIKVADNMDEFEKLPGGMYIIRYGNTTKKIMKK